MQALRSQRCYDLIRIGGPLAPLHGHERLGDQSSFHEVEAGIGPDDNLLEIDARPSDAIALAIRTGSSIWMLEEVVAEASIAVDAEADAEDRDEFRRFLDKINPAALGRHLESRPPGDPRDSQGDTQSP